MALGLGLPGALASLVLATGLGLGWAIRGARRAYRGLLADRGLRPEADPRALLGFSLPQGLTAAAFRLNSTLDVLMLAALAGDEAVGVYKVAASLAAFGALPSNAVVSVFNPWIVELHQKGDRAALNA
ncbi:MAG: oligosaccharide flippase family protein, partial [bacterium]